MDAEERMRWRSGACPRSPIPPPFGHPGPLFDLDEARKSYYTNLFPLNPGGIVPAGPTPADLGFPDAPVAQIDATAFSYYDDRGES